MKINKFLPFKDVVIVDDAATIRAVSNDEKLDRQFKLHNVLNRFTIKRSLKNLSYNESRFPHMLPKHDAIRLERHTELWNLFNFKAAAVAEGSDELEPIS